MVLNAVSTRGVSGDGPGDLVKVVAIGGSVTTGMGALKIEDAYPNRIVAWLRSLGHEDRPVRIEVHYFAASAAIFLPLHAMCRGGNLSWGQVPKQMKLTMPIMSLGLHSHVMCDFYITFDFRSPSVVAVQECGSVGHHIIFHIPVRA